MKKFLLLGVTISLMGNCLCLASEPMEERPIDALRGTDIENRLKEESSFIMEKYADLIYKGASANLQHVWNPSHTIIIFFDSPPPSGTDRHNFWVFRKEGKEAWEKVGEYHYCSRYAPDWDKKGLLIEDNGFFIIIHDGDTVVKHFFDFTKSKESFDYRMSE